MPELQPDRPRLRLDAVAGTSFALAAMIALALGTHPPLTGFEPAFGPLIDSAIAPIALALGYAIAPMLAAWLAITILYIRWTNFPRLLVTAFGWLILVAISTILFDYAFASPNEGNSFGPGGSVGAFLRFALADRFSPFAVGWLLGGVTLFGLALVAPRLMKRFGRGLAFGLHLLWRDLCRVRRKKIKDAPILLKLHQAGNSIPIHYTPPRSSSDLRRDESENETLPDVPSPINYELPPLSLLADADSNPVADKDILLRERATLLEKTFADFGLIGESRRHSHRAGHHAVRNRLGNRPEIEQGDDARGRRGTQSQSARGADRRAAAGPQHRRHRSAERTPPERAAQGTHHHVAGEGGEVQAARLHRQGCGGPAAGVRSRRACRTCSSPAAPVRARASA